jgi:hypothetical protein
MSKVSNDSFQTKYNKTITAADVNAKFSDVATASSTIDEQNVRNEGIDRRNLGETPNLLHADIGGNEMINATSTYTFDSIAGSGNPSLVRLNQTSGGGTSAIDFGQVITLQGIGTGGDLLRLHYSFLLEELGGASDPLDGSVPYRGNRSCIILFPAYSTDGANWFTFPNRTNWFAFNSSGVSPTEVGPKRDNGTGQEDKYEMPRNDGNTTAALGANFDDGLVVMDLASFNGTGRVGAKYHGCLNFRPPNDLDIRYISFWAVGPLMPSLNSIYGTGRSWAASGIGVSPVKFERAHFAAFVLGPK